MAAVRVYDQWMGGSSAAGDPGGTEYNSVNAQVYENGTLGPRPGWKEWTIASSPVDAAADTLYGIGLLLPEDDSPHLIMHFYDSSDVQHEAHSWTMNESTQTITGGTSTALTNMSVGEYSKGKLNPSSFLDRGKPPTKSNGSLVTVGAYVGLASATDVGTLTTPTTADLPGSAAVIYRERAYYFAIDAVPGRIYYSDPADYTTVGALSYFDVNPDVDLYPGAPSDAWSVKNALLIACKDGRWLVLTGASPDVGSLRELGLDVVPNPVTSCVVDNQVYFLNPNAQGVGMATPSYVETKALRYLSPTAYPGNTYTRPNATFQPLESVGDDQTGGIFLPGRIDGNDAEITAVERVNDVWNLSLWDYDTATPEDLVFTMGRANEMYAMVMESAAWPFYSRNFTLNRPANSGDSLSKSLNNEDGVTSGSEVVVELGEIEAGSGQIVRPVKVVLDIDYWKGGNYSDPELKIDAKIHGTEGATSEDALTQQVVTTTSWGNTTGDKPNHRRVPVPLPQGQYGTRFDITITYDNLALDSVQVYYEEQRDPR